METDFVFSDGAGLCSRVSHSETGNLKSIVTSKLLFSSAWFPSQLAQRHLNAASPHPPPHKTPTPETSLKSLLTPSSPSSAPSPPHRRQLPPSIHRLHIFPSTTPPRPIPPSNPMLPDPGSRYDRGFRPRACGSVFWRWDCRLERVRWAEGERGDRRARAPDWVVRRRGGEGVGWGRRVIVEG